jgi:hypothetical protein
MLLGIFFDLEAHDKNNFDRWGGGLYKYTTVATAQQRMGTEVKSPPKKGKYFFIIFYAGSKWIRKDPFGVKCSRPYC